MLLVILTQFHLAMQVSEPGEPAESYVVLLRKPSVVEELLASNPDLTTARRRLLFDSPAATAYQAEVEAAQERMIADFDQTVRRIGRQGSQAATGRAVRTPEFQVIDRRSFLSNLLVVQAGPEHIERLRQSPEVAGVYPNLRRYPQMDRTPELLNAVQMWNEHLGGMENAGRGIRIGIIDSGIRHDHPMFRDDGLVAPNGFPRGNPDFTNNKVIVARSYPQHFPKSQPNKTPEDEFGHGSQVAGIAAGRETPAPLGTVRGMAPMAFLGSYKVFGNPELNPSTTVAAVLAALNDAVEDGMDVINMSLGGPASDLAQDPEQEAIRRAVEAGIMVVVSAGNAGPRTNTISSPGTSPDALTVGSVSHGRVFAPHLNVHSEPGPPPANLASILYTAGQGVSIPSPLGPVPLLSAGAVHPGGSELACSALPAGSLAGKIALVARGACLFQQKADFVFSAGARAMIVYNNVDDGTVVMGFDPATPLLAVMIEKKTGEELRDFLNSHPDTGATLQPDDSLAAFPSELDRVSSFSSRGPNVDRQIKPDLSAIGQGVYTASNRCSGSVCQFSLNVNGTSFSTPMVSGAAALLLQLHPGWSPRQIKSALVNTASKTPTWNGQRARLIQTGNGRLDVAAAARSITAIRPVSQSFGILPVAAPGNGPAIGAISFENPFRREFQITNLGSQPFTYQVGYVEVFANPSIQIQVEPTPFSLDPGESQIIEVTALLEAPLRGGSFEGFLKVTPMAESGFPVTASIWGGLVVEDPSTLLEVSENDSGDFSDLQQAVDSARPGNIIEIDQRAGGAGWQGPFDIEFNQEGLPLQGLTLRAKSGRNPVLEGLPQFDSQPLLRVRNVEGIRIQGLTLRNHPVLVSFVEAGGELIGNTLQNSSATSASVGHFGISLDNSRAYLFDNRIENPVGSGIAAFNSAALIVGNNIAATQGSGSMENGIFVSPGSQAGIFENQVAGASTGGQGIRISDATAAVRGNQISGSLDSMGDGLLLRGGTASAVIQDNRIRSNKRHGISLFEGSSATLFRNRIEDNAGSGLFLTDNSALDAHSVELLSNGMGIRTSGSARLLLSDSLVAGSQGGESGQGISAAAGSQVTAINVTIAENLATGIELEESAWLSLANSIVFGNRGAFRPGNVVPEFLQNLIEDSQFAGKDEDGNFNKNPLFVDAGAFDFRLQPDSPAIDAGRNELAASAVDLFSHQRIVAGKAGDRKVVDLGAVEFASDRPAPLILPVLSSSDGEFVGLAMTNAFQSLDPADSGQSGLQQPAASVVLRAWDGAGNRVETDREVRIPIGAGQQMATLIADQFGELKEGWIEILPAQPDLKSFAILGTNTLETMDGAQLATARSTRLVFPEIRSGPGQDTTIHIVNPNDQKASLTLSWIGAGENRRLQRTLPARGMLKGMLKATPESLFENVSGGYLMAVSDRDLPLYGMEIFGTRKSRGGLLALDADSTARELFGAQMASGNGLQTTLNVINLGEETELFLEAFTEGGEKLGATVTRILEFEEQLRESVSSLFAFGDLPVVGWLKIQARNQQGRLLGSLSFEDSGGRFLASLPLQSRKSREFIFSHVADDDDAQVFTGITLLNASFSAGAVVSLEVFTPNGTLTGKAIRTIGPGQKLARLLKEWIPGFKAQQGGFIRIRSSTGLFGFELFGSTDLQFLAAVPQQTVLF